MKYIFLIIIVYGSFLHVLKANNFESTVFLSILARNKAHTLPLFLQCIKELDYEKKLITVYINTNNNVDKTAEILEEWIIKHRKFYKEIIYEKHDATLLDSTTTNPHEWSTNRFHTLACIRNKSLKLAQEKEADFYFVVDCDNFIKPETLKNLINENKPIIAPMLVSIPETNDYYSNFFCAIDAHGYYKHHENYNKILRRELIGTFEVPVIHCTYLIQVKYLPFLSYTDESSDYEFVIFSRAARKNHIKQYITNKNEFGTLIHFFDNVTLQEERQRLRDYFRKNNFN